ncbi:hypothetical protein B0H16DRAFT_1688349 [Mycena metata]|uniref:Uncharacterized protein n=1 Tax=Mycena metata TaxID=1033252 RepID=A0AAD7JC24_9AGAR|nr:hypothetical protein B0H16DRAFT_1688349 [Mycena metata]
MIFEFPILRELLHKGEGTFAAFTRRYKTFSTRNSPIILREGLASILREVYAESLETNDPNGSKGLKIVVPHLKCGPRKQSNIYPLSSRYHHLLLLSALKSLNTRQMPPKHTPGDTTLIESLPMGVTTAFRCSIYVDGFVIANPLLFIGNEWVDATQLRYHQPSLLEKAVVKSRIRTEGTRKVVKILSDSDEASGLEDFEVRGHGPRVSSPLPPSDIPTESSDMYLTACPSLYPIPSTPTAFVIDAQGPRLNIAKKGGGLHTVDALIKHKSESDEYAKNWESFRFGENLTLPSSEKLNDPIQNRSAQLAA